MDRKLIEQITREVVARLGRSGSPAAAPAVNASGGKMLAVFTGGLLGLDAGLAQVRALRDGGADITLVLSPGAVQTIGRDKICSVTGVRRVVASWREVADAATLLAGVTGVLVPVLTLNTLSKVAMLQGDSIAAHVIVQALLRNIRVVAALEAARGGVPTVTGGIKGRFDKFIANVQSFGMCVVPATQLAATLAGPRAAVPAPVAAPVTDGAIASGISVGDKTVSVCTGNPADCAGCGLCVTNLPQRVDSVISAGASRIGAGLGVGSVSDNIAGMIDHTQLKAATTRDDIVKLCEEAKKYQFASVCVNTHWAKLCAELLKDSPVKVCTVVGFPLGAMATAAKAAETMTAVQDGAEEIDMVINIGALKAGEVDVVRNDIAAVVQAAGGRVVKVILETALLTDKEKVQACELAKEAGAHFVKTSTGFGPGGATISDIALMRSVVGPDMGVKASGGVRDREGAQDMIRAGATRIGASASVAIAEGATTTDSGY